MSERRGAQRVPIALECTLRRRSGSAIPAQTVDVGPGGMCVATRRPLATDEVVTFELPLDDAPLPVDGRARVLRQQGYGVYALRFERLPETGRERLAELAAVAG